MDTSFFICLLYILIAVLLAVPNVSNEGLHDRGLGFLLVDLAGETTIRLLKVVLSNYKRDTCMVQARI